VFKSARPAIQQVHLKRT